MEEKTKFTHIGYKEYRWHYTIYMISILSFYCDTVNGNNLTSRDDPHILTTLTYLSCIQLNSTNNKKYCFSIGICEDSASSS